MYIARDKDRELFLYIERPTRRDEYWESTRYELALDYTLFPNLRWEDEPIEVDLFDVNKSIITDKDCIDEIYWREVHNNAAISAMQGAIARDAENIYDYNLYDIKIDKITSFAVDCADVLIKKLKIKETKWEEEK